MCGCGGASKTTTGTVTPQWRYTSPTGESTVFASHTQARMAQTRNGGHGTIEPVK